MDSAAIRRFAAWAREELILRVGESAAEEAHAFPTDSLEREKLAEAWFHRLIALRFMERNGLCPLKYGFLEISRESGMPDILNHPFETGIAGITEEEISSYLAKNDEEGLWNRLLSLYCASLSDVLPGGSEDGSGGPRVPRGLLRPDGFVRRMARELPPESWLGSAEILGRLFQSYSEEPRGEAFSRLKQGKKLTREEIPIATQIFTPDWIARALAENTAGALWAEGRGEDVSWEYLARRPEEPRERPACRAPLERLRVLDPCAGSGHLLAAAFDLLLEAYRAEGWSRRDAARSILKNNLYGLELDPHAAELAAFSLLMKATVEDTTIPESGRGEGIRPHIACVGALPSLTAEELAVLETADADGATALQRVEESLRDAAELGSLADPERFDTSALRRGIERWGEEGGRAAELARSAAIPLLEAYELLTAGYDAVMTNPPYLSTSSLEETLARTVRERYPLGKADLFSCFILRCFRFARPGGRVGILAPYSWMYLRSHEALRRTLFSEFHVETLVQLEYSAYIGATVPLCFFTARKERSLEKGVYVDLSGFPRAPQEQARRAREGLTERKSAFRFERHDADFFRIPGCRAAFRAGPEVSALYESVPPISESALVFEGLKTRDNDRFVRLWHEVSSPRWVPYAKGGPFRRWAGNEEYVLDWGNGGESLRAFPKATGTGFERYFEPAITYTAVTSYKFSARFTENSIFGGGGGGIVRTRDLWYLLAFLNSRVFERLIRVMTRTMNFEVRQIRRQPLIVDEARKPELERLARDNVALVREDCAAFETSRRFSAHPLIGRAPEGR